MIFVTCVFFCFMYLITFVTGEVVSFIDPCKPDDQACILTSAIKALPYLVSGLSELGVHSSDPLSVETVQALDGDLKLTLYDIKIYGIKNCKLTNVRRDATQELITLVAECPFNATGKYDASGKVIVIPIEGNGSFNIKTDNIRIKAMVKVYTIDRDGKKYWTILNRDVDFEPIEKVFLDFENLYDEDKEKGETLKKILDQSWRELITTVGKPMFAEVINKEVDNINTFLNNVPLSELEKA